MDSPGGARWRAQLRGWRGGLFALLGLYALGATVFLLAGGGQPTMTSLVAMEAEVEGGDAAANASQVSSVDSASAEGAVPDGDGSDAVATAASELPPDCNDIDPVEHDVDPGLTGVHALGFVTLEEQPAAFAGYEGCPLIVNFFASWCVPCVTEMPDFERFWNDHGTQVAVLGLAANDRLEDAIATVADRGVTYPTGLDEGELFIDFGGLGMPTTVFVSPEGQILETHSGLLTLEDITTRAEEHFGL
ncbi:MAG: TlpA disulfide reductase family protein [Acidimicrobiaceae bacterium]|nr:TlpA disulfide reductase family protein [Acidimicrobiaceae bacterium]MCY3949954.1 TlpA disulfide reductase family protein [Acidimicrobiaceae bacterium]